MNIQRNQRRLSQLEQKIQAAMDAAAKQQCDDAEWLNGAPLKWFIPRMDGTYQTVYWQPWMGSMSSMAALLNEIEEVAHDGPKFGQRSLAQLRDIYNARMRQRPREEG